MNTKAKGSGAERELIHFFWANGWAAVRVAGSGSMKYPSPDVVASNSLRRIAVECKSSKSSSQYLPKEEINLLKEFASRFGAEPWIGVKFGKSWAFMSLDDLGETGKSFAVSRELAAQKGLSFEEMIGRF